MRIEFASAVTRSWVRLYTRRLEADVRASRIAEIESDLWEHRRETADAGADPSDAGLQVLARCLAGMPADLAWRSGAARPARSTRRRESMNDQIRKSWWLVPAVLVGLFDVFLFIGQLTQFFGLIEAEPRVGTRFTASAVWFVCAVCLAVGLALRDRRPQRAGVLVIIGSVPALMIAWAVVPPLVGLAAIIGAIDHMTTAPSPTKAPA